MEQDDDMENIRRRIDRKRTDASGLSERDARKNALCNKIQEMKNSFPGLRDRINALQDTDPDMATYIRKLEAISEDFHTPVQTQTQIQAQPDAMLEKFAQRVLDAEARAAKLSQDLREQNDILQELRSDLKRLLLASGAMEVQAPPPQMQPTQQHPVKKQAAADWGSFDISSLPEEPEFDPSEYMRGCMDTHADTLLE